MTFGTEVGNTLLNNNIIIIALLAYGFNY